jgi:hypothetical protein
MASLSTVSPTLASDRQDGNVIPASVLIEGANASSVRLMASTAAATATATGERAVSMIATVEGVAPSRWA